MMNASSGYVGWSMSENAANAYYWGEKPLSKWTKAKLIKAVVEFEAWSEEDLKCYTASALRRFFLYKSSWHHTSKVFNETDFYAVNEDRASEKTDELVEHLNRVAQNDKEEREERKAELAARQLVKGVITFDKWEGSRNYGKFVRYEKPCIIVENWAYTLDGKKDIYGNHVVKVEEFKRAPKGTAEEYKAIERKLPKSLRK